MKKTIKEFEKAFIAKAVGALNDQVLKDKEMRQVKGGDPLIGGGPFPGGDWPWCGNIVGMIAPPPGDEVQQTYSIANDVG